MTGVLSTSCTQPQVCALAIPERDTPIMSLMAMKKIGSVKATEIQNLESMALYAFCSSEPSLPVVFLGFWMHWASIFYFF
jgi:hypothetical protein